MSDRIIKFRAWDGEKMHEDVCPWRWDFVISRAWHRCEKSTGDGILGSGGKTGEFLVPGIAFKKLMQFTGLKDKNGVEIYEGDVVKRNGHVRTIIFDDGAFCISGVKKYDGSLDILTIMHHGAALYNFISELEVIGNIYENSNLLTKQ